MRAWRACDFCSVLGGWKVFAGHTQGIVSALQWGSLCGGTVVTHNHGAPQGLCRELWVRGRRNPWVEGDQHLARWMCWAGCEGLTVRSSVCEGSSRWGSSM